jgi:hypothetical protein
MRNKNKRKNKTAALDLQQDQTNTQNIGFNKAKNPAGRTEVKQ